jgi:hypothetical protein
MKRARKELVDARIRDLLRIILDGAQGWDLCDFVRENEKEDGSPWHLAEGEKPLSYSQIRRYAVKAEKLIAESCRASRKRLLRRHLAQRRNLYAKAVLAGDYRTALAALRDEADLEDLYPSRKTEHTGRNGGPIRFSAEDMTDDELAAIARGVPAQPARGRAKDSAASNGQD